MSLKLTRYVVATPSIVDAEGASKRVVFATRTTEMRFVADSIWQMLLRGEWDGLPAQVIDELISAEILVPQGQDELAHVLRANREAARDTDTLSLVVMPTASCQLGCGYCGQEHFQRWLSPAHQDKFLGMARTKLERGHFQALFIRWFGAEPLSGFGVMRRFSPRLKQLASDQGCSYGARIVTNGLALTESVATELVNEHNVTMIDITLDGPAIYHDARRMQKNGRPTFARIFANVVSLAKSGLDVQIKLRMNVDGTNSDGVVPLLRSLAAEGIQDRIQFYLAPIHAWGNDANAASHAPEEFARREIEWFCEMLSLGFTPGVIPKLKRVVCMAVEPDSTLVDATGTLFSCTEVPYVPAYGQPNKYAIGDLAGGEVEGRRNLLASFDDRVQNGEYPCSTCRMLPVCGGACPKAWLEGHPPCPSTLHNIEARLLLAAAVSERAEQPETSGAIFEPRMPPE